MICPECSSEDVYFLGPLGSSEWFRCRDCGADFFEALGCNCMDCSTAGEPTR
jgi:hypothetical protein